MCESSGIHVSTGKKSDVYTVYKLCTWTQVLMQRSQTIAEELNQTLPLDRKLCLSIFLGEPLPIKKKSNYKCTSNLMHPKVGQPVNKYGEL